MVDFSLFPLSMIFAITPLNHKIWIAFNKILRIYYKTGGEHISIIDYQQKINWLSTKISSCNSLTEKDTKYHLLTQSNFNVKNQKFYYLTNQIH